MQGIAPENLYYLSVLCASAALITDEARPGVKLNLPSLIATSL